MRSGGLSRRGLVTSCVTLAALVAATAAASPQSASLPPLAAQTPDVSTVGDWKKTLPPSFPMTPGTANPNPPAPNKDLDARVRELEEIVRRLKGQIPAAPVLPVRVVQGLQTAGETSGPRTPPIPLETGSEQGGGSAGMGDDKRVAGWDDGFFLRSADGNYHLRITGQIQTDLRDFVNDRDQTDISTFLVRRARLGIEATVYKYFEFRLLPDFGQNLPNSTFIPQIQDAYLNVHYIDTLQIAAGKIKQPVSYEQLIQDRFVPTVERSLIDQLVPARDVGLMVHGYNLLDNKLDYAIGVFNGGINANTDTNGFKDIAWRVAVRPLNFEEILPIFHRVQIGISGTTGVEVEPINPAVLRTPLTVPFFTFNPTVQADGLRNRWTPEFSYFYRGLGFAAQYYDETQRMIPSLGSKTIITVPFDGYYVMATYLLTGESRTEYSKAVVPVRSFEPLHPLVNPGAWELVARYSRLDVGSIVFAPGPGQLADPAKNANRASELTLGFNWYLNAWVRMQFNWEHAWFANGVPLGGTTLPGLMRSQDTVVARLQVIF